MLRRICRGKLHGATVTEAELHYEGSIQIDETLMEAAGILEHEMVQVANMSNGERFETYVIKGARDSGIIGLNGAAARKGVRGDKLIIFSSAYLMDNEVLSLKPAFVYLGANNKISKTK